MNKLLTIALLSLIGTAHALDNFTCTTSGDIVICSGMVNGKYVTCTTIRTGDYSQTNCR